MGDTWEEIIAEGIVGFAFGYVGGAMVGALASEISLTALTTTTVTGIKTVSEITGYTRHALNQAIDRDGVGVSTKAILEAVRNPEKIKFENGVVKYIGENATVILNEVGKVITTWARNSRGFRIK